MKTAAMPLPWRGRPAALSAKSAMGAGEPQEQCSCTVLCTEGAVNPDCPVCSADGADLSACQGEAPAGPVTYTCITLCTEGSVNGDCPVCSAAGADLSACQGTAPAEPVCTCTTLCTEGAVDGTCPVCGAEGADLTACQGKAPEAVCTCTIPCAEGAMDETCPVCGAEGADPSVCAAPAMSPLLAPKSGDESVNVSGHILTATADNPVVYARNTEWEN